jgi:hypothetical protein
VIWTAFLWYCFISVLLGSLMAVSVAFDQWKQRTGRQKYYSPNKSALGYAISAIIGCPVVNVVALILVLLARCEESYRYRSWGSK